MKEECDILMNFDSINWLDKKKNVIIFQPIRIDRIFIIFFFFLGRNSGIRWGLTQNSLWTNFSCRRENYVVRKKLKYMIICNAETFYINLRLRKRLPYHIQCSDARECQANYFFVIYIFFYHNHLMSVGFLNQSTESR